MEPSRPAEIRTCREFIEKLAEYLAGELTGEDRQTADLHLRVCPECVRYLKDYEVTVRLGADAFRAGGEAAPATELPDGFAEVLLSVRPRKPD
jgi:hypothetical protein